MTQKCPHCGKTITLSSPPADVSHGVEQFITAHIRPKPTGIIAKQKLYDKYLKYCVKNNYTPYTHAAFSKAFIKHITPIIPNLTSTRRRIDGTRHHCWAGIIDKTDY